MTTTSRRGPLEDPSIATPRGELPRRAARPAPNVARGSIPIPLARGTQPEITLSLGAAGTAAQRPHDTYLASLAHDLKNPLSLIALEARRLMARTNPADDAARRSLDLIAQNVAFVGRMLRDLLDLSAEAAGHLHARREATCLRELLAGVVARSVSLDDRDRVSLEALDPAIAHVDPLRLERVVENLLQNAIKFSPPGAPIRVRLELVGALARISVIDRGCGLSDEEARCVFDAYHRARAAHRHDGVGLGLHVSRMIVEAHGGQLGVEHTPGGGATFYVELPAIEVVARPAEANPARIDPDDRAVLRAQRVLIVDDEPLQATALHSLLSDEGMVCTIARSAHRALMLARLAAPDVVVTDLGMSQMGGLELIHRLRAEHPQLAIVLATGHASDHPEVAAATELGCAYIAKPLDLRELARAMVSRLRWSAVQRG